MAKGNVKTIDDFFKDMRAKSHKNLDDSFTHYEKTTNEDRLNEIALEILQPAIDKFYDTFKKELDNIGLKDNKSIANNKKKEVQGAAVKALMAFFKKVRPGVLKGIDGIDDVEERYKILTREYNSHVGIGSENQSDLQGIDKMIDSYIGNEQLKVAELKRGLYNTKAEHVSRSLSSLKNQAYTHFIGTYHAPEVAVHLEKKAKKKGYKAVNKPKFRAQGHSDLYGLHDSLTRDTFGDVGPKKYHLKKGK